jgi:hypothetical protein
VQRVEAGGGYYGRREAGEIGDGGGDGAGIGSVGSGRQVVVPVERHVRSGQQVAIGELCVRWVLLARVQCRIEQQLRLDTEVFVGAACGGDRGGEVAAGAVAGNCEPGTGMGVAY